jgi:hypothetical protein
MAPIAIQGPHNEVTGVDAEGLVQQLLLFDHCIIPSIWLEDVQHLLRVAEPRALCELIDSHAISFYIDSATAAETGQARSGLGLTGNTTHLRDNEFSFSTIKVRDDPGKVKRSINALAITEGVSRADAASVAERVEASLFAPKGLEVHAAAFKEFYRDLRDKDSTIMRDLVARRLRLLGANATFLQVSVEEFVEEDFRINSNLTTTSGLSSRTARQVALGALFDLASVHIRVSHMREFSCLLGMNESEQASWDMKADALVRGLIRESRRDYQFTRVARIAGLGENQFLRGATIDLRRLMDLRRSEEMATFKAWLKQSDNKSDKEIRDRVSSIRSKIGNAAQRSGGKIIRLMLSALPALVPNPLISLPVGLALSATDLFLLERAFPKDAVLSVLGKYPSVFGDQPKLPR